MEDAGVHLKDETDDTHLPEDDEAMEAAIKHETASESLLDVWNESRDADDLQNPNAPFAKVASRNSDEVRHKIASSLQKFDRI